MTRPGWAFELSSAVLIQSLFAGCTVYQDQPPANPASTAAPPPAAPARAAYAQPADQPGTAPTGEPLDAPAPASLPTAPPGEAGARPVHVGTPVTTTAGNGSLGGGAIQVVGATYGGNCNAPYGNATGHIASQCNGQGRCIYRIDHRLLGDPAVGCQKDYVVEWTCGGELFRSRAAAEAGWGNTSLDLACPEPPSPPAMAAPTPPAPPPPTATANVVIEVTSATYGANCGATHGNVTEHVASLCQGQVRCDYQIDYRQIGDPVHGCPKDFVVEWRCGGRPFTTSAAPEAGLGDKRVRLSCEPAYTGPISRPGAPARAVPPANVIQVVQATFGGNCRAPQGNATQHVSAQCNGQPRCDYRIDYRQLGDPAYGCEKDYTVEWQCTRTGRRYATRATPEAGWGDKAVTLTCD